MPTLVNFPSRDLERLLEPSSHWYCQSDNNGGQILYHVTWLNDFVKVLEVARGEKLLVSGSLKTLL